MKKLLLVLAVFVIISGFIPFSVSADDIYSEQYSLSGADKLQNSLDDETREFLNRNGIDASDGNWTDKLTAGNVFVHIAEFVKNGAAVPLSCGGAIIGIIIVFAVAASFDADGRYTDAAVFACMVAVVSVLAGGVWPAVSAASSAVKGSATFMLAFVPVFASLVALSGGTVTAAAMGGVLLASAETVSSVCSFAVLPLAGGYLAVSVCGSISNSAFVGLADGVKKLSVWILSLISTVFLGVLSIQTVISSASDTVALKTTKFIVGTTVPVAGQALSEAASAVTASVMLLRSSVGIYGVVAIAAIFLPILTELMLWRAVLIVCAFTADTFGAGKISGLLRSVDGMISVLLGIALLVAAMFIISLAVVITAGRAVF